MTLRHRLIAAAVIAIVCSPLALFIFGGAPQEATGQEAAAAGSPQEAPARIDPIKEYTATGQTADEAIAAHENATEGPEQPIPFNHRFHTQELQMQCEYCHGSSDQTAIAVMPAVD
ncbi:MAG: cytochrome c3 family protein, partial [Gemmatimonadetes bacterium]|nr:cytochrome c3 family protein [Gemmatimonadota bacterium]